MSLLIFRESRMSAFPRRRLADDWPDLAHLTDVRTVEEPDRPCQWFPGCKNAEPDKPCCMDRGMEAMDV